MSADPGAAPAGHSRPPASVGRGLPTPAAGILGIDIGGTKVALRVEAPGIGEREKSFHWATAATPAEDMALLADAVAELLAGWPDPVRSVGVAVPATVDEQGSVSVWPSRPSWTGLPLGAALRSLVPDAAVRWADDGDLAAIAEADAAGERNLLYVGVGTGIGGGIVLGGAPVPDPARGSCELGHVVVDRSGPACGCGRFGCLQAIASGAATLRRAASSRGTPVSFADLCGGMRSGSPWAVAAVDEACAALACAVASVNELVRPACAVIGGGFAAEVPGFVETVAAHLRKTGRGGHPVPPLRSSLLGGLSSLRGAVLLAAGSGCSAGLEPQ